MKNIFLCLVVLAFSVLAGCEDGTQRPGFKKVPDMSLASLTVAALSDTTSNLLLDFEPNKAGIYTINVDNSVDSIVLTPTLSDSSVATLISVYQVSDDGNGLTDEFDIIGSGESITRTLNEGSNDFRVRLTAEDTDGTFTYTVLINRTGSQAGLKQLGFYVDGSAYGPDFYANVSDFLNSGDPLGYLGEPTLDTVNYELLVRYDVCSVEFVVNATQNRANIYINGESVNRFERNFVLLTGGSNIQNLKIVSENLAEEANFTFNFNRQLPENGAYDNDPRLSDFSASEGKNDPSYYCRSLNYIETVALRHIVRADVSDFQLTLSKFSQAVIEDGENQGKQLVKLIIAEEDSDSFYELVSGQPFPVEGGSVPTDFFKFTEDDGGVKFYIITVDNIQTGDARQYRLQLVKTATNWVEVNTPEQLQAAISNAQANDEIIVAEGDYQLSVNANHPAALLYSNQSGSAENPIYLRSEGLVTLKGNGAENEELFRLEGAYWNIRDMYLSDSVTGLILSGANNNYLSGLGFFDLGERALVIDSGSSNNILTGSIFSNTGVNMNASESAEIRGEAIVIGENSPFSENNQIVGNEFGSGIVTEILDIKANAADTLVMFNGFGVFTESDTTQFSEALLLQGRNSQVKWNTFSLVNTEDTKISELVYVSGKLDTSNSDFVVSNYFDAKNEQTINFVNAPLASVKVAENTLESGESPNYVGGNIDAGHTPQIYQIESKSQPGQCLTAEVVEHTILGTLVTDKQVVVLDSCSGLAAQQWQFEYNKAGAVEISLADKTAKLYNPQVGSVDSTLENATYVQLPFEGDLSYNNGTYAFLWRLSPTVDGAYYLVNQVNALYGIQVATTGEGYDTEKSMGLINIITSDDSFKFTLNPL